MASGTLLERTLFAKDMVKYFFKKYNIQWTPPTYGENLEGHDRKFTKAMGFVAKYLVLSRPIDANRQDINSLSQVRNYLPKFPNGYNHEDFLFYCGIMGFTLVCHFKMGKYQYGNIIVYGIKSRLDKFFEDRSFPESGGWNVLAKYAEDREIEIRVRSLVERILFGQDLISYFMERCQNNWIPAANGYILDDHCRRFIETIGPAAWWLVWEEYQIPASPLTFYVIDLKLMREYHPGCLLLHCGEIAMSSVCKLADRDPKPPDEAICDINNYLIEIYKGDSFHMSGGWDGIAHYAHTFLLDLMTTKIRISNQLAQASLSEMQQAEEVDILVEEQCIGSLLRDV